MAAFAANPQYTHRKAQCTCGAVIQFNTYNRPIAYVQKVRCPKCETVGQITVPPHKVRADGTPFGVSEDFLRDFFGLGKGTKT